MANQETEETFEFVDCCVRGYHVTEKHWNDIAIGEGLIVCHEENNKYDPCAMAVYREHGPDNDNINVGHIPIELSSTLCFFVKHGRKVSAKVRQETYRARRASNLEQGGLEVPITVHYAISTQKAQFLTRLKQLTNKRWRDLRDFNDSEHYNKRKRVRQS